MKSQQGSKSERAIQELVSFFSAGSVFFFARSCFSFAKKRNQTGLKKTTTRQKKTERFFFFRRVRFFRKRGEALFFFSGSGLFSSGSFFCNWVSFFLPGRFFLFAAG